MAREVLREFLEDPLIPAGTKIEGYLTVLLGLRDASMLRFPHDLPDASILETTIRTRFRDKVAGKWIPGNSLADYLVRRMLKSFRWSARKWSWYATRVLSNSCREVLSASTSFQTFLAWGSRLRLGLACLQVGPSEILVFLCRTGDVASRIARLFTAKEYRRGAGTPGSILLAARSPMIDTGDEEARIIRELGRLLGYPSCCVQRYILDRETGALEPLKRGSRQLVELDSEAGADLFAYFAGGFVPCSPGCERASAVGRRIYAEVERLNPTLAGAYENRLRENLMEVLRGEPDKSPSAEAAETLKGSLPELRDLASGYRDSDGTGED